MGELDGVICLLRIGNSCSVCNRYLTSIYNELGSLLIMGLGGGIAEITPETTEQILNYHLWRMHRTQGGGQLWLLTKSFPLGQAVFKTWFQRTVPHGLLKVCIHWTPASEVILHSKQHRPLITWLRIQSQLYPLLTQSPDLTQICVWLTQCVDKLLLAGVCVCVGAQILFCWVNPPPVSDFTGPFQVLWHHCVSQTIWKWSEVAWWVL